MERSPPGLLSMQEPAWTWIRIWNRLGLKLSSPGLPDGGLPEDSVAVCHQITTLDRSKLTRRLGALPASALQAVEAGLRAAVDLDS
jgi:PemK-like, MazF-like toxin of type II toxin-antitoxin system